MELNELRGLIASSSASDWFNSVEVEIDYQAVSLNHKITGISALYKFLSEQTNGWSSLESFPQELSSSSQHFSNARRKLSDFVSSYHSKDEPEILSYWNNHIRNTFTSSQSTVFTYDSSEVKFLLSVHQNKPKSFRGAYDFLVSQPNLSGIDNLSGAILGYEFRRANYPKIKYKKLGEVESFRGMINDFKTQISDAENELSKHLSESVTQFTEYSKKIDSIKEDKETLFNDWHENATSEFDELTSNIGELEDTYKNKLQLEKPAEYWSTLSGEHRAQGWIAFWALVGFVALVVLMLGVLLWKPPSEVLVSFFGEDKGVAIRWSM